jgi:hypothetical protein
MTHALREGTAGGSMRGLAVASALAWCWGVLLLVSAVAVGVPMVARGRVLLLPLLLAGLGAVFCWAGHGLRRQRRGAAWTALIASAATSALLLRFRFPISAVGLVLCLAIVVLVLKDPRALR